MNLLFLKKRINKFQLLFLTLVISNFSYANDSIPTINFLDHCKKSNAYLLYSYTDVSYSKSWSKYRKEVSVNNKLVVNNISGVEDFAFLNLTEYISNHIKEINVKVLKADGTVLEVDSSLVFKRTSKNKKFNEINYPIPGVEPGDTIETAFRYFEYIDKFKLKGFVNLYSAVPSLKTEHSVRTNPDLFMRYKTYNNFPVPQVLANDSITYALFKMKNLKGIVEKKNMCLTCDLPYVYYSLNKDKNYYRTWKDVYNQEFNIVTQPLAFDLQNSSYYRRWKRKVIGTAKDSSKYYKFKLLHKDIIDNITMQPIIEKEVIKSSGYFLKKKHIDPFSIKRLYRKLLEDLEIEYSAVFARTKQSGKIDPYYIRMGEYDHIFFAYNNGHGSVNLLYPHNAFFKYQINEIPTSIYNTQAVITKPYFAKKIKKRDKSIGLDFKLAEVDSVTINTIILPGSNPNRNYIRQVFYNKVDLKNKNDNFKFKFTLSGALSTELRSFYNMLDDNKEVSDFYDALSEFEGNQTGIKIDSVTSTNFTNKAPFNYYIYAKGELKDAVTFLNDSLISVSLDKLIQHSQIEIEKNTELNDVNLNYYLDYNYTDYCMTMIDFPCEIEVVGINNSAIKYKNEFGEYVFSLKIVNNKQLTIKSNYKILKDMIPKEKYNQLEKLNKHVKDNKNRRFLIKLKNISK